MLVLTNEEVSRVLTMDVALAALEETLAEEAHGRAINQARYDVVMPLPERSERGASYRFQTYVGVVPKFGIAALRMTSGLNHRPIRFGREVDERLTEGTRPVGLVQLYSVHTGEPLAFMHDELIQVMRVGATYGLACKYLAREDAAVMGMLGAGWQARFQVLAASRVRPLRLVKVYDPRTDALQAFVQRMTAELGISVQAVDTPEAAVSKVDILVTATNARGAIVGPEVLVPGMHVASVRNSELSGAALQKADRIVALSSQPFFVYVGGEGQYGTPEAQPKRDTAQADLPLLEDIIIGRSPGRTRADEITVFNSGSGMGVQFTALSARVYALAQQQGLGREIPTDWLVQET